MFGLIGCLMIFITIRIGKYIQPELSNIQMQYMGLLSAFIINYYIMRNAGILPYIKFEADNFKTK